MNSSNTFHKNIPTTIDSANKNNLHVPEKNNDAGYLSKKPFDQSNNIYSRKFDSNYLPKNQIIIETLDPNLLDFESETDTNKNKHLALGNTKDAINNNLSSLHKKTLLHFDHKLSEHP